MTSATASLVATPRWHSWVRLFVRSRHPLLIAVIVMETWHERPPGDWGLLSNGAHSLFSSSPLSTYATNPGLQAGAPGLAVVRALDVLPGTWGVDTAQLLLALLGWYLLFLAERWSVPGARFASAPLLPGVVTLVVGVPVLMSWAALSGGAPHIEDALALVGFALGARAVSQGRTVRAALLVGLAAAAKPWAVVALPLLWGLSHRRKALLIAVVVPVVCWLPFLVGDRSTLSAVSDGFGLQDVSPLHAFGMTGAHVPNWWRSVELSGSLAAACLAALRRDWRLAFAAGVTARLLLDPAGYDYYVAGLLMATVVTERLAGLAPWRTALLYVSLAWGDSIFPASDIAAVRLAVLAFVLVSYLHPWHEMSVPSGLRQASQAWTSDVEPARSR